MANKTIYTAIHHAMSLEEPESGTPPTTFGSSESLETLERMIREEMDDGFEVIQRELVDDEVHFLGAFEVGEELCTYYVIHKSTLYA